MLEGIWWVSYGAIWLLVLLEAVSILALARQVGLMHKTFESAFSKVNKAGLEVGALAPAFGEQDLNGKLVSLGVDRKKPSLLVFISPDCSACANVPPAIRTVYGHEKNDLDIIIVSLSGDQAKNRTFVEKQNLNGIPYVASPGLAEKYHVSATPYAILVDAQGIVQTKGVVNNLEHIESLLNAHNGRLA